MSAGRLCPRTNLYGCFGELHAHSSIAPFVRSQLIQRHAIATAGKSTSRQCFSTASRKRDDAIPQETIISSPASRVTEAQEQQSTSASVAADNALQNLTAGANSAIPNPAQGPEDIRNSPDWPRRPRALQAIYLKPLKRRASHRIPVCDLQLRSYGARNLEFFADFALRAAYYLGLPASGPVPLPRITERWTVPRSNFIFKKSQENFERITMRRLIQIQDGNVDVVEIWLAFLRKHALHGVGMKANVWKFEKLGVGKQLDADLEQLKKDLPPGWSQLGRRKTKETSEKVADMLRGDQFKDAATLGQDVATANPPKLKEAT